MYVVVAFVLLSSNICFKNTRKSPPVAKDKQAIHVQACRGVANHGRVAEGTRPSPEGVYSGGS